VASFLVILKQGAYAVFVTHALLLSVAHPQTIFMANWDEVFAVLAMAKYSFLS